MRFHWRHAFPAEAIVPQLSEAPSYMLMRCGGPTLIDAVEIWDQIATVGRCPSSYSDPLETGSEQERRRSCRRPKFLID